METKVQNIISIPVTQKDLQKLNKAIDNVPNPLFGSTMDLLKKFTINIYHILMDSENGKQIEMETNLKKAIYDMYHPTQTDEFGNQTYNPINDWNDNNWIEINAISKKSTNQLNQKNINKNPKFTNSQSFDKTIRLKLKGPMFNRLIEFVNFNEKQLIDILALYLHLMAKNHHYSNIKPNNQFLHEAEFHYVIGVKKINNMFKNTIIETNEFYDLDSFSFYENFNKPTLDGQNTFLNPTLKIKTPIKYTKANIQKNYFNRILIIRKHINEATVDTLYVNPTRNQPNPENLNAFDYLNLLFTEIIIRGHIESNDTNFVQNIRKYEDTIPVTNFLIQEFNKMKSVNHFGFAKDILYNFGENLDKKTQIELINHLNDYKLYQLETENHYNSNYTIDDLHELSPEKLKDYILETFNLKHVDGFRKFLSNNPQWVK